jgi:mono/diheme cytochrome c family protein
MCIERWFAVVMVALALASCGGEKHSRGIDYMPDMYESPAYKSQQGVAYTISSGAKETEHQFPMMMPPPEGSVARDGVAYDIAPTDWAAARKLVNPLAPTAKVLKTGQKAYNIYCAVCHGNDGNAGASSYIPNLKVAPPALTSTSVAGMPDGQIYHIVTLGRGAMPSYSAQVPPIDRWALVHYVRALNGATLTKEDAEKELAAQQKRLEEATAKNQKDQIEPIKELIEGATRAVAQANSNLKLIQQGGNGDEFVPPPAAVPEYITPQWPEK